MFCGKSVIVTGATSGIGLATALRFAEFGASLALVGRNSENLKEISERCADCGKGKKPLVIEADVSKTEHASKIIKKTIKAYGQIDVLVNSAGVFEKGSLDDTSLDQLDHLMNVNFRSIFNLTLLAKDHLIESRGNIVNVSCISGSRTFPDSVAYCASKAALDQFTRCAALELAPQGVRVNTVNPGTIRTELYLRSGLTEKQYKKMLKKSKDSHPIGRSGEPCEVARAIVFLANDEDSSFITGENLHVDGGRQLMTPKDYLPVARSEPAE